MAAVVHVPSAAWVAPVTAVLRSMDWGYLFSVAHPSRRAIAQEDADRIAGEYLSTGGRVLGVSHDAGRNLPRVLVTAADLVVTLRAPDGAMLVDLVRIVTGRRGPVPPIDAAGLDLDDIAAAVRRNSTPVQCAERLARAVAARLASAEAPTDAPSLDDLHGYGPAMAWARQLVAAIAEWRAGRAPFPTGQSRAVLAGPPGTGKTMLARAIARSAGLPFLDTSVGRILTANNAYLDNALKEIDATFARARALGSAVVLWDEIDAVPSRESMVGRDRGYWTPVVAHLLTILETAASNATKDLVVIGATNYAGRIDPALVRPGRLERIIEIRPPEAPADRVAIIRHHLQGDLDGADLTAVGLATTGSTGADLMALVRDARRRAAEAGRDLALADIATGAMPHDGRSSAEDRRCAVHEAGHAAVAIALGIEVRMVTLVATSWTAASIQMSGGASLAFTRADLTKRATVLLAGLAAEETVFGDRSVGAGGTAGSDLAQATRLFADLHAIHGLGGRLTYAPHSTTMPDRRLADVVERELQSAYAEAGRVVSRDRRFVEALAAHLVASRVLSGAEVLAIHRRERAMTHRPRHGSAVTAEGDGAGPHAITSPALGRLAA